MENNTKVYKVVFVGDGGVGKTTLKTRLINGRFDNKYVATLGVEVDPIYFNTNYGTIRFNIWDTAGQEKFGGLRDGYYVQSDACLAMMDVSSNESKLHRWIADFHRVVLQAPIVVCGNKADLQDRRANYQEIVDVIKENNLPYFEISTKTNSNIYQPFLHLARTLSGHEDLVFLE